MSKPLKFASRVELFSENGKLRDLHREAAVRMLRNGQAVHRERGTFVRKLVLVDHHPEKTDNPMPSNSWRTSYSETLNGGNRLTIETASALAREVTTSPCRTFKMKPIRGSLKPLYEAVVREATVNTPLESHNRSKSRNQ